MNKLVSYEIDFIHANGEARSVVQFAHSEREAIENLESRNNRYVKHVVGAHLFMPDDMIEEQAENESFLELEPHQQAEIENERAFFAAEEARDKAWEDHLPDRLKEDH